MKFENVRGYSVVDFENGVVGMSVRDYAFMTRLSLEEVICDLKLMEEDVPSFVFISKDDEIPYMGIAYNDRKFAIIGCKKDSYVTYSEMMKFLTEM